MGRAFLARHLRAEVHATLASHVRARKVHVRELIHFPGVSVNSFSLLVKHNGFETKLSPEFLDKRRKNIEHPHVLRALAFKAKRFGHVHVTCPHFHFTQWALNTFAPETAS